MIRYWQSLTRYWQERRYRIGFDTGRRPARYWQGSRSILAGIRYWQGSRLPILAGAAILAISSIACSSSSWEPIPTASPEPTSTKAQTAPKPAKGSPTAEGIVVSVTALQSVNVRQEATKSSSSIAVLYSGDSVVFSGTCRKGWAQILYKSARAWVDSRYLSGDLCKEKK